MSTQSPISIRLKDLRQDAPVDALLHLALGPQQVSDTQASWELQRKDSIERLLSQGWTLEELPKHWGWDWTRKISRLNDPLLAFYGIECNSQMQGLIEVAREGYFSKLATQQGKPLVYVKYLETAPWNIRILDPNPLFGGIGSRLMRAAMELSINEACKGRVGLHSLPGNDPGEPEWFYKTVCLMESVESERDSEGLLYFELSEDNSTKFLNGGRT